MITRRQFILGVGALTVSTILSASCGVRKGLPQSAEEKEIPKSPECDLVIDNIWIIDGTGKPAYRGKLAVKGEEISAVGDFPLPQSVKVIDGEGLVLSPGFIDIHTHTEDYVHSGESLAPFLSQGVTTQVGGNCGRSPQNIRGFLETMPGLSINYGLLMGYRTLRELTMGGRKPGKVAPSQLTKMQEHLAEAFKAGVLGLSVGLEYWPQNYATTEEIIELCQVVKEYRGFYATHIRSEYDRVESALEEAIEIGNKAEIPVQYSHIKAGYKRNWSKFPKMLEMLEKAKTSGLDITADVYSYTYSSTDIGKKPFIHSMSEENLARAVSHPQVFFASDTGIYTGGRAIHPRAYGNFPRVLGSLVRDKQILTLEEAIAKMTSRPAQRLRLENRGILSPGYKADLVLFDPKTITDKATCKDTTLFSEGVRHVWVNGRRAWENGKDTKVFNGQILTYQC